MILVMLSPCSYTMCATSVAHRSPASSYTSLGPNCARTWGLSATRGRMPSGRVRCAEEKGASHWHQDEPPVAAQKSSPPRRRDVTSGGNALEICLLQRLSQSLTTRRLLLPRQRILVAVSGGQDSVGLLHLLAKLRRQWEWELGVAHCDHQWSCSARKQANHVARMAQGLGLNYYQALTPAAVPGEGVARAWRYGILQRIAVSHGYEVIVTAHTASDRVETLLFNLFRGTGVHGLQALTWKRVLNPGLSVARRSAFQEADPVVRVEDPSTGTTDTSAVPIALVRPLLDFTRTELRNLCDQMGLPLWPDPSNHSLDIDRNRIRHQLLPYLRRHFNPGIDKSLARWAEILHAEQSYLDSVCESIRMEAETSTTPGQDDDGGSRKLDLKVLRPVPVALQRRVLKRFTDGFTGKSLGFDTVEQVRRACFDAARAKKGLQVAVPGGFCLRLRGDDLIVARLPRRNLAK